MAQVSSKQFLSPSLLWPLSTQNIAVLVKAYKAYVRPILEYGTPVNNPYKKKSIDKIEKVRNNFKRKGNWQLGHWVLIMIRYLKGSERNANYRLKKFSVRRKVNDLLLLHKVLYGQCGLSTEELVTMRPSTTKGRANKPHMKTAKRRSGYDIDFAMLLILIVLPVAAQKQTTLGKPLLQFPTRLQMAKVFLLKSIDSEEFLAQPIPKHAEELTGQALVDYVNEHQPFFKAEYSPSAEQLMKSRVMSAKFLGNPDEDYVATDIAPSMEIPERFDARERWPECTSIGFIRDQSNCGSCWAVSSAAVMSDRVCIQSNGTKKAIISDGDLLSCCRTRCGFGCAGGWPIRAFNYFSLVGICTGGWYREKNACKPYPLYPCGHHQNQTFYGPCPEKLWNTPVCRSACQRKYPIPYRKDKIYGNSTYIIPMNQTIIMTEIMTHGPVVATYKIYEDFSYYKGGIYVHTAGEEKGAHAVRVIGWGEEKSIPYWLVANSWNTDWGEKGYFRILRGRNHCDIENQMIAGMVKV
ncbi:hypothetical protein Y032_0643g1064 [Ancylostoma ceylanicum]|uniref:Peptidase C1A papain C-terminal domain-containing protein n=1 Tax=Ancylostoma ceylanicum TaxID=53326 RepID=A0A016WJE9_9BILA|nr:hypothetical protein Y032_0643g1064 [Ancylostoma ceylanicum]